MLTTVTLQAPPPLSASSPPVDKLIRKSTHSFPWHQRKVQTPQSLGLCAGVFTQVLPPKHHKTQGHSPFLWWSYFWTVLGAWPALPESLNMWIINFSLPSRCICGIISLDSKPIWGGGGSSILLWSDHNTLHIILDRWPGNFSIWCQNT